MCLSVVSDHLPEGVRLLRVKHRGLLTHASFEDQTEESDQDSGSRLAPDQVNLSVPMTVAERALVFEAITAAKIQFGMEQGGPALCQICRLYLNRA